MNGFAPGLGLIKRLTSTRKWAIPLFVDFSHGIIKGNSEKYDTELGVDQFQ